MARRVGTTLDELGEPEVERLLVLGAVVQRQGDHYWIVSGEEPLMGIVSGEEPLEDCLAPAPCTSAAGEPSESDS
jgi:hypothetical protein